MGASPTISGVLVPARGALLTALALLAGCASDPPPPAERPETKIVRGADQGLEVVWWPVDDSTGALARALAPYAERPVPISATRARTLRANGLRIVAVPLAEVDGLREFVRLAGPVQRQWHGQLSSWTSIICGPSWEGDRIIELDQPERQGVPEADASEEGGAEPLPEGLLRLGPGKLCLLARCWIEPSLQPTPDEQAPSEDAEASGDRRSGIGAVLHIDIVPQHEEAEPESTGLVPETSGGQRQRGLLFSRLLLGASCAGDEVLMIVPETPGARWRPADEASNDAPGTASLPPLLRGLERPPTLGEAMLTDAASGGFARTRVVVLLFPRVPEGYSLLGQ